MRKVKRILASLLVGAMLAGTMSSVAYAETAQTEKRWVLEDDGSWYYFKGDKMLKNRFVKEGKQMYALSDDGSMFANELIDVWADPNKDGELRPVFDEGDPNQSGENVLGFMYAFPDGRIAKDAWVKLDDDGKRAYNEDQANWYYFDENCLAVVNGTKTTKEGTFRFDDNGVMIRKTWAEDNRYYTYFGDAAQSSKNYSSKRCKTFLYIDGKWFKFKESGEVDRVEYGSDKPKLAVVKDIAIRGEGEIELEVGEQTTLVFDVELATYSNAQVDPLILEQKCHDFYVEHDYIDNDNPGMMTKSVKSSMKNLTEQDAREHTVKVDFYANAPGTTNLALYIDGIREWVTINTVMSNDADEVAKQTKSMVNTMLNSVGDGLETHCVEAVKGVVSSDSNAKEALKEEILDNKTAIANLESSYVMIKGVNVKETDVSEDAAEKLQSTEVNVIGAALNVDTDEKGVSMQLSIDTVTTTEEYDAEKVESFDISMEKNGTNQTEFDIPFIVEMSLPKGFSSENLVIYHTHNGITYEVTDYSIDGTTITFIVDKLSTFTFVQGTDNDGSEGGSSSIDPGSKQPSYDDYEPEYISVSTDKKEEPQDNGEWLQDGFGWWHKNPDGTYPANKWEKLAYNGKTFWYFFDTLGYMKTGWIVGQDGNWYYLNPSSNGFMGAMVTGWQQIDGFWYYFNAEQTATEGAMYVNTITPDGYKVNELGQWIQ